MTGPGAGRQRVRMPYVEWLMERLSERDWTIITTLWRIRLATGIQLERLHFSELSGRSRSVMRWRVLKRLVDANVLTTLDRRVGTALRGSVELRYTVDTAGLQLLRLRAAREDWETDVRRPRVPGDSFIAHVLAVTELYVTLTEQARHGQYALVDFQAEGAAYWPDGLGGLLKPDAFVKLQRSDVADYWWYEAELTDRSLPRMHIKLARYVDFVRRGQLGPDGIVPRVCIGVPTAKRQVAIQAVVDDLPEPAAALFVVVGLADVAHVMLDELQKE